jgi:RNA polymerase sigma factor (sigma-70 family)
VNSVAETNRAIDAVWRMESPKLIAGLTRMVRDISMAEELAADALLVAMKTWPEQGVPRNPGAWLMQTAKRRAIDYFRRNKMAARKLEEVGRDLEEEEQMTPDLDSALDDDIGDDLLKLIFTSCHPILSPEARAALTLRLVGGLTTEEIAKAFLAAEPTIQQRIVRAKKTIAEAHIPFEVPRGDERKERIDSVLEVIYLIFNEGYAATAGASWMRSELCDTALRLIRTLSALMPDEPEVHGLAALLEIQASRAAARTNAKGEPILLLDQDRKRWDRILIRRGLTALERAEKLAEAHGPYALQAALAACHARARTAGETDWPKIAALYVALGQIAPSPVVELNRAVAFAMAFGPEAGLEIIDQLTDEPALRDYHLLPSVRGDFLFKLGRKDEARGEFERAAAMTRNDREKVFLMTRAAACG